MKEMYRVNQLYTNMQLRAVDTQLTMKTARYIAKLYAMNGFVAQIWKADTLVETWKRKKVHVYRVKNMAEVK